ncbi:hypothetical protein [Azospirillum brasilense]|uniref:hypothetical protein n=1 Tax=Azospirillum brasilense TaxID=192 RepID=UPI0010C0A0A0|nr:hypothetical protein [Azospirillum brasilense]
MVAAPIALACRWPQTRADGHVVDDPEPDLRADAGNILITSTGGVVDSGTGNQYTDLPTGVWVKAPNG